MTALVGAVLILAGFVGVNAGSNGLGFITVFLGLVYLLVDFANEMAKLMGDKASKKSD